MTALDRKSTGDGHVATCLAFPPSTGEPPLVRYAPGSVLSDKYRLDALLGEGGMGAVWRATNLLLDSAVAIKLIRADLDRGSFRERLQLEARAAARLGHPAIVRVFDVGESDFGDPFIVMELLHGQTLAQMLTQGRLPAVRAVQIVLPIIDALAAAHARGIVHRDLKPDNLLIASEDQRIQPKVVDFGIAKLVDPRNEDRKLTDMGALLGSPDYMSPEQACGRDDLDYRTDIWSVCVVLYEAVTGCVPFNAPNYNALLRAILEDEPPSLMDHAACDAELWEVLRIGLSKDRLARQSSMSELGRALAGWLLHQGVTEDICGTSVEPKWFGRGSSLPDVHESSGAGRAAHSSSSRLEPTHQSLPSRDPADSRGPFAATIGPQGGSRKRTVLAAVGACALVGALALGRIPSLRVSSSAVAAAHPGTATEHRIGVAPRKEPAADRVADPAPSTSAPVQLTAEPQHPVEARQKPVAAAHPNRPRSASSVSPGIPPAKTTLAKPSSSDLGLIAPY